MAHGGERKIIRYGFIIFVTFCFLVILNTPKYMTRTKQVAGWEMNVSRSIEMYVRPEEDTLMLGGRGVCPPDPPVDLLIVVCSAPAHADRRAAIRATWASSNNSHVRVLFLLGLPTNASLQPAIEEENEEFRDVVQERFVDTYNNLTVKSVMMLKWFLGSEECRQARYLMKTDDDMLINVTRLQAVLVELRKTSLLVGALICRAKPILDFNSKWYNPKYIYPQSVYPNYLSGTGYVMSRDVAEKLYHTALTTTLVHLEDVFLTGICAAKAGIKPHNHGSFTYQRVNPCDFHMATNHRLSPSELREAWAGRNSCHLNETTPAPKPARRVPPHCR